MDITWILLTVPALLISMFAQWKLNSTYSKYSQIPTSNNLSGTEAGDIIIKNENLSVTTEIIEGKLTDHYDSANNIMRISSGNTISSIAGVAVVAHELGHACQDRDNMGLLKFRNAIVPIVNIGSNLGYIMIIAGLTLNILGLSTIGVIFFSLSFIFSLITLPIEFNASNRAMKMIETYSIIDSSQLRAAREVLNAAALTYVAGMVSSFGQLLYFIFQVSKKSE